MVGYDDTCANDLDFVFRLLGYDLWEHRVETLVFPFGMNLTQDLWNEVFQCGHSLTKVIRIYNVVANVDILQDGAEITGEVLFSC